MKGNAEHGAAGHSPWNSGVRLDQGLGIPGARAPAEHPPPEGTALSLQSRLLGQARTTLALLGPAAQGQRQKAGMVEIELSHQPLGRTGQGILVAASADLVRLVEVALQGHRLKREAAEQRQQGNPKGQRENETLLRGSGSLGSAGNNGSHGGGV